VVGNFAGFLYRRSDEEGIQPAAPPKPSVEWTAPPAGRQHCGVEGQRDGLTGDTNDLEPGLLGERFAMWDSVSRPSP
jgi:hypothetical protein